MRVKEWQGEVVFLHEVAPGAADRSYGIHVAKLAGLPAAVVARAEQVLAGAGEGRAGGRADAARRRPAAVRRRAGAADGRRQGQESAVERMLAELNPDELTPRQALELLYALRARCLPSK